MVNLVRNDLEFILRQIRIAEAHAAGGDLATLVAEAGLAQPDTGVPLQAHLLPYGLRTVDGSYNNLLDGREEWGAADGGFAPITPPSYLDDQDGDSITFGAGSPGQVTFTDGDYGEMGTRPIRSDWAAARWSMPTREPSPT